MKALSTVECFAFDTNLQDMRQKLLMFDNNDHVYTDGKDSR